MGAPDERNGAVGAAAVAAFGNLEIGVRLGRACQVSAFLGLGFAAQGPDKGVQFPCAKPAIHLRDKPGKFLRIALGQAAEHQQASHLPFGLAFGGLQDGIHGLLLGIADKAAGVDKEHIHRTVLPFRHKLVTVLHLVQEMLGIDGVLGAAQGYDLEPMHSAGPRVPRR